jgi:sulfur-carrier protein
MGRLADVAGAADMAVPAGAVVDILAGLPVGLSAALLDARIKLALNGAIITDASGLVLADKDELAFLPPVSGG